MRRSQGYILFETIVALGILSLSIYTIYEGMRQAMVLRMRAQDFTMAQFLMEDLIEERLLQPELRESAGQGQFPAPNERFSYEWKVSKLQVPLPSLPPMLPQDLRETYERQFRKYMGRVTVRVMWRRGGLPYDIKGETLIAPEQLWVPEPEEQQAP
jgi:hypothetical protein